jgi:hypothetical protein
LALRAKLCWRYHDGKRQEAHTTMTSPISSTSGISSQQAQWLVTLLQSQMQSDAVSLLANPTTSSDASGATQTPASFADMLTSALESMSNTSSTASAPASTTNAASATGSQIASVATQLAGDLRGSNNQFYDVSQTPTAAQAAFNTPGWGNGNIQCVAFVDGVFRQAGITLPATPNGAAFWQTYQGATGWNEIANGQGLPQPGDIIAFAGGAQGFGHVAVVTGVVPPGNGQPGTVTFAQANSPTSLASLPIALDGTVAAWPGYQVQGYIRAAAGA